jgi:thiol-disulfide isomerase/thioredoxin
MKSLRWSIGALLVGAAILSVLFLGTSNMPTNAQSGTVTVTLASPTKRATATAIIKATSTPAFSSIASPTPTATEDLPPYLFTLTAFNGQLQATFASIPTATPGVSALTFNGKPNFVDFYATWCGPCRSMKPIIRRLEEKYGDQINFWTIDIDNIASDNLVNQFRVQSIPMYVFLDAQGKKAKVFIGTHSEKEMEGALLALLK